MPYSYATSQDFLSLSKLNAEPLFTVYACYKKLQSELNAVQGTSIKGITKDELLAKTVMVPQYAEQQQIGAFFRQLDNLITLHQRQPFLHSPPDISLIVQLTPPFYTFSWEQRKLTEFVEFFSGLTYTPNDVQENGTLVLRSSNVSNGEVVDADNIYVNPQVVNSENVKVGDIVVVVRNGSRSLIGKHAQIKAFMPNTVIGAFMTGIRSECPEFTNALLNTSRFEEEIAMNMGATINQITGYMFSKMEFKVPCLDEQKKIGEYFEKLDNLITLHPRKFEKLTNVKKSMLEKMFPQNGSSYPEIRFKGFTDPWEQRKVQDVADRFDNLRIPVAANLRVHGTTPYYGANGIQDYVEGFTHDGEFVLVAEDGANDLKNYPVKCVNGRIWVNNHAHVLQGKAGIADNSFLAFAISQSDIESLLVGGGRAKLNAETLMSIEFRLPCLQEQYRIGEYLTQLDHLITLHQRKPFLMKWRTSDANRNQTNRLVL